jgi:hypothetical protein
MSDELSDAYRKSKINLSSVSTHDLITELSGRSGARVYTTDKYVKYCIEDENGIYESDDGPAKIIVTRDVI